MAGEGLSPGAIIERAIQALNDENTTVIARSRQWRSAAWPDPTQGEYRNAVCIVETALGPDRLMVELHRLEAAFGRARSQPNAPRTLDLDLIAYGRIVQDAAPILPHPRAAERGFVMGPLAELTPHWVHPTLNVTASALAATVRVGVDAAPVD